MKAIRYGEYCSAQYEAWCSRNPNPNPLPLRPIMTSIRSSAQSSIPSILVLVAFPTEFPDLDSIRHHVCTTICSTDGRVRSEAKKTTYPPQTGRTAQFQFVTRRERRSEYAREQGRRVSLISVCRTMTRNRRMMQHQLYTYNPLTRPPQMRIRPHLYTTLTS